MPEHPEPSHAPEPEGHLRARQDYELKDSFDRSLVEGATRLHRRTPNLLATGFIAGIDVGFGVLAMVLVEHMTGSDVLGGLAFTIGFLALALGRSELFTENFLDPITTVITRKGTVRQLLRLWGGTYVMNLLGGWALAAIMVVSYPEVHELITDKGADIMDRALSLESFTLAILAGGAITLMTWMQRNAETEGGRLISAVAFGFLLGAGHLNHVVVISIKMFATLQVGGTEYGYADWLALSSYAALGNMVGGLGLVTILRLVQIGRPHITRRREEPLTIEEDDEQRQIIEPEDAEGTDATGAEPTDRDRTDRRPTTV